MTAAGLVRLGADPDVVVDVDGVRFVLDARGRTDAAYVWQGTLDDLCGILARLCREFGPSLWDIGANVGRICIPAAVALKPGPCTLVAVEPVPANADRLAQNLALNGVDATVLRMALGETPGELPIAVESTLGASTGNAILGERLPWRGSARVQSVPVRTLDDLVLADGHPVPDVVKIDVEGAEVGVLAGATRVLQRFRPIIVGEFNSRLMPVFGHTFLDVPPLLPDGYGVFAFRTRDEVVRVKPSVGRGDVLLVPEEKVPRLPFKVTDERDDVPRQ